MAPVLEHLAAALQPAGQRGAVVGAEAGEEGQLVAAGEHVDGVDLHEPQAVQHPAEVAPVHPARSGRGSLKPWAASAIRRASPLRRVSEVRGMPGQSRFRLARPHGSFRSSSQERSVMRVVVDFDLCESNALCMAAAPEVFEVRDDDFLYVLQDEPAGGAAREGRGGRPALPQAGHHASRTEPTRPPGAAPVGLDHDRRRRRLPRRAARRRGAASQRLRRHHHAGRRRAAPPLRTAAAVEAGARRDEAAGVGHRSPSSSGTPDDLDLDWRLGQRATGLDLAERSVLLGGGERLRFDGLVIATGASPKRLPGTDHLDGVHTLRTLDDCLEIRAELERSPRRVAVVGAGFIGAEVAATCRGLGIDVSLIEALPVPLERGLGPEMGAVVADLHRDHGVDVRLGVGVVLIEGGDRVERIRLTDGAVLDIDVVVVGIGVTPNTSWLEGSGLTIDNGVLCDATCTAAPGVVAAGDVARWPNPRFDEIMRVEHWDNAIAMGAHAARSLLAGDGGRSPTTRSRGSGPISTTARSSSPGAPRPMTASRSWRVRWTSGASSRSTAARAGWWVCSA